MYQTDKKLTSNQLLVQESPTFLTLQTPLELWHRVVEPVAKWLPQEVDPTAKWLPLEVQPATKRMGLCCDSNMNSSAF